LQFDPPLSASQDAWAKVRAIFPSTEMTVNDVNASGLPSASDVGVKPPLLASQPDATLSTSSVNVVEPPWANVGACPPTLVKVSVAGVDAFAPAPVLVMAQTSFVVSA